MGALRDARVGIRGRNAIEMVLLWYYSGSCGLSGVYDIILSLGCL